MLLLTLALCLSAVTTQPEMILPGPTSGIALKEQPGLLITNCRTHTQRVFVRLNPMEVYRKHVITSASETSWAGVTWTRDAITHATTDTTHMLQQLEKFAVTQADLSGLPRRSKRFVGGLLVAAATIGSLFSIGTSTVNAVSLHTVKKQIGELQAEIPMIRQSMQKQAVNLQTVGETVKGTILVLNTHSVALNQTRQTMNKLLSVVQIDYAHTQIVTMLMNDMLREVSSSIDSLAMGRIPPYLVPLSLVDSILTNALSGPISPVQAHLAFSLGSATVLYVNPEFREVAFLVTLPIIDSRNIYRLKDVVNVGTWQDDTFVKINTPPVVAYHDSNPDLYLAPNLNMCTLTKDVHYLCPSKPFIRDVSDGICGLKPMKDNSRCRAEATPRYQVLGTQAEIVGTKWLVTTPALTATLSYDHHDTSTRVTLPNQTMWIDVPKDAILHIEDVALYHLPSESYESEIEVSQFFSQYSFKFDPKLVEQLQFEGTQAIDLTTIDATLHAISADSKIPDPPFTHSWSAADSILGALISLGYLLSFGLAYLFYRKTQKLQCSLDKCNNTRLKIFKRSQKDQVEEDSDQKPDDVLLDFETPSV